MAIMCDFSLLHKLLYRYLSFKINHFPYTVQGIYLKSLKGIHQGKRCFIIGNGPSLTSDDLDTLKAHNEITFAFNRIFHIFDSTSWRPTYYISQDEKMLTGCQEEVGNLEPEIKFIPAELQWYNGIKIKGSSLFHIENCDFSKKPLFSENIAKRIYNSRTVVYTAIQIAVYMGFKEIYLIGVDHHFHTSMNSKGEIVIDKTAKDYFSDKYNEDRENLYIPNTDLSTLAFIAAKEYADAHGIKIYNATRGGKLEVFPRVDFEELF